MGKIFEGSGYDQEELYFHKLNTELKQKQKESMEKRAEPKNNVLEFKAKGQANPTKAVRKAA